MENYIVRIYRRGECENEGLVGHLETVETGEMQSFHTLGELTSILARAPAMEEETTTETPCYELDYLMEEYSSMLELPPPALAFSVQRESAGAK